MTQRLRIETDHGEILRYIEDFDYPNKVWLENPWMLNECIAGRVFDEYGTLGYIWGHWGDAGLLTVHVGLLPGTKLDWRGLFDEMMTIAYFLGADEIGLSFDGVPRAKALIRLVTSLGFTHDPENPYGVTNFYRRSTHGWPLQA